jgi:cysteine desulfurase/selenocysteine lyase
MNIHSLTDLRSQFPVLERKVHDKNLIYFDNGATTLKPLRVIKKIQSYYNHYSANIHRGVHTLSEEATWEFEESRLSVQQFLNARSEREIIFTKGTTESFNLLAQCWARVFLDDQDEIVLTALEHHANIVPWQLLNLYYNKNIVLKPVQLQNDSSYQIDLEHFRQQLTAKTKLVSFTMVSNGLGIQTPYKEMISLVRTHCPQAKIILDGAQAVAHFAIDVQEMDCDFFVFSGHKIFGPTGVGVLYGKESLLEKMPPYQGGGDMIASVSFEKTTFQGLPAKFEAGTPPIASVIALKESLNFVKEIGFDFLQMRDRQLAYYLDQQLRSLDGLTLFRSPQSTIPIASFVLKDIHPHDIGTLLDEEGIAIRTGHHCNGPLMKVLGVAATARASLAFYNTEEEIDLFIQSLRQLKDLFS